MPVEIVEKELSYKIVQAAYEVFNGLGPGFLEKIYQEAMILVLRKNKHNVEVQKSVPITFMGKQIGVQVRKNSCNSPNSRFSRFKKEPYEIRY